MADKGEKEGWWPQTWVIGRWLADRSGCKRQEAAGKASRSVGKDGAKHGATKAEGWRKGGRLVADKGEKEGWWQWALQRNRLPVG